MRIPIDHQSGTAMYKQISEFLRESIYSGSLQAGARLPATRQLARDLGVNRITIANAYAELQADGLIYSQQGSGTYVAAPPALPPCTKKDENNDRLPPWQQQLQEKSWMPATRFLDALSQKYARPGIISFEGATGDSKLFSIDDFRKVIQSILRRDGEEALGYGERPGYSSLRRTIAQILTTQGIAARPEEILIASGSQQALALVIQALLHPGDAILVECPTYAGALDLFRAYGLKIIGVALDEKGMCVEKAEEIIQREQPRLIYTIPNFQNPTGVCLSSYRRRQLIALACNHNIPILEDDFVGDLRYEGYIQPALKALDPGGWVIYVSTFSKMLMPGLRVGFLVAQGPIYEQLLSYKRVSDLATSNLVQRALDAYITVGRYQAHLRRSCQSYRRRCQAMINAIERHLPAVRFTPPKGGIFAWLQLPYHLDTLELYPMACEEGVAYTPGFVFCCDGSGRDCIRLNFAAQPPEMIEEGIKRLGKTLQRAIKTHAV